VYVSGWRDASVKRNELSGLRLSSRLLAWSNDAEGELGPEEAWVWRAKAKMRVPTPTRASKQAEAVKQYTVSGTVNVQ
jgi:hypothetical protein